MHGHQDSGRDASGWGDLREDLLQRIQDDLGGAWFRA